jgi:hypothetical protein
VQTMVRFEHTTDIALNNFGVHVGYG